VVLARQILEARLSEEEGFLRIRSVTYSLIHEYWQLATLRQRLSVTQWEAIRNVSFPNDWNRLFKFEKKRVKGQINRFNVPSRPLTGEHKKKLIKAVNKLVDIYIRGSFKPMCPELRKLCNSGAYTKESGQRRGFVSLRVKEHYDGELAYLKKLMTECGGNIQFSSERAGVNRSCFRRALDRFPEVNWKKEFPLTYTREPICNSMDVPGARKKLAQTLRVMGHKPPPNKKGTKQYKKWKKTITATHRRKKAVREAEWKVKLMTTLRKHNHKRRPSAEELGVTISHMVRLMSAISQKDPQFKAEFLSPELSRRLKKASCRETIKANRVAYLKENKHLILQAYYQNGESDCAAGKILKMDTRTVTKAREEIAEYEL
jgi:hypothetical protein